MLAGQHAAGVGPHVGVAVIGRGLQRIRDILHSPELRKRLIVAALIFVGNAVGYWGFLVFLQKYMISTFKLSFRHSLALTALFYVAMIAWPFIGARVADRFGRRPAGVAGALIIAVGSLIAFSTHSLTRGRSLAELDMVTLRPLLACSSPGQAASVCVGRAVAARPGSAGAQRA